MPSPPRPAVPRTRPPRGALALALALLAAACGRDPLAFAVQHLPVGYDAALVLDVAAVDPDHDGDADLLVATDQALRYLEQDEGRFVDGSPGAGLQSIAPVSALHPDGDDLVVERAGVLRRLRSSGIGSWHEVDGPLPETAPPPVLELHVDLDGDGTAEHVRLSGRGLALTTPGADGAPVDVTAATGASGLHLPGDARRLLAVDLEGDGDLDLLAVGGRLFVLRNDGGRLDAVIKR